MFRNYQGHVRSCLEVPQCIWNDSVNFQDFVKIVIFMHVVHHIMIPT